MAAVGRVARGLLDRRRLAVWEADWTSPGRTGCSTRDARRQPGTRVRSELEQMLCERSGPDHTTLQVDHAPDELLAIGDGTK